MGTFSVARSGLHGLVAAYAHPLLVPALEGGLAAAGKLCQAPLGVPPCIQALTQIGPECRLQPALGSRGPTVCSTLSPALRQLGGKTDIGHPRSPRLVDPPSAHLGNGGEQRGGGCGIWGPPHCTPLPIPPPQTWVH